MIPHRTLFWHIQSAWIFYLFAVIAVLLFAYGIISHLSVWTKGIKNQNIPFSWHNLAGVLVDGILGRRIFRGDVSAGIMHFLIFWGFISLFAGTVLLSIHHYLLPFLDGSIYLAYSICLDMAGVMLMIGLVWSLARRYLMRLKRLERRTEDLLIVLWLLAVVFSGFIVEGLRLSVQQPEWAPWSFAGYMLSILLIPYQETGDLYYYFWWIHVVLSLGIIAAIPYCKLFHVLSAPVNIYLKDQPLQVVPAETAISEETVFSYLDMISFDACIRCGRCMDVCPSHGTGEPFGPRDLVMDVKRYIWREYGLSLFRDHEAVLDVENLWYCTTCRACLEVCPVYIRPFDVIRQMRSREVEDGVRVPQLLIQTLERLYKYNNPWESSKKNRTSWSHDLEIPHMSELEGAGAICYFVGCTTALDTRAQNLARSFVSILKHTQISFGTLGKNEPCCGDIARRVGEEGLFESQMEECLGLFARYGVREVVTSSPHCLYTFRNEYPAFQSQIYSDQGLKFFARHYTELLSDLLVNGLIRFEIPFRKRVTYHDPCYLGRYNRIFDAPRAVITAIPGIDFVEMAHHREYSLCCGGGGGRMWQEGLDAETKMSEIRIKEAHTAGAEIVITACPLCLIMLEDARKTAELEESLEVMDLNELVVMALGIEECSK